MQKSLTIVILIGLVKYISNGQVLKQELERVANRYLMTSKRDEVLRLENSEVRSYDDFRRVVEESPLLDYIIKMPKGATLHGYLYGLVSYEYMYSLTQKSHLMGCINEFGVFRFSYEKLRGFQCELIEVLRQTYHDMDNYIKEHLSITNEEAKSPSESTILVKYKTVESLVSKKSVLQDFLFRMLYEQLQDGVIYVQFRSSLTFYDSEIGLDYRPLDVMEMYKEVIDIFKRFSPTFIGAKVVYSPYGTDLYNNPKGAIDIVCEVAEVYPDLLVGIEFFVPVNINLLSTLPKTVEVYYHYAKRLNLNDFIKYDRPSSRIVSISEREIINDQLLSRGKFERSNQTVVIEVCPTSVYFQQYKEYLRHVVSNYITENYRIIICSEYPGLWRTRPLSYNWYLVLMFMINGQIDIQFFRKLAINSLIYSNLDTEDKMAAISVCKFQWDQYQRQFISHLSQFD